MEFLCKFRLVWKPSLPWLQYFGGALSGTETLMSSDVPRQGEVSQRHNYLYSAYYTASSNTSSHAWSCQRNGLAIEVAIEVVIMTSTVVIIRTTTIKKIQIAIKLSAQCIFWPTSLCGCSWFQGAIGWRSWRSSWSFSTPSCEASSYHYYSYYYYYFPSRSKWSPRFPPLARLATTRTVNLTYRCKQSYVNCTLNSETEVRWQHSILDGSLNMAASREAANHRAATQEWEEFTKRYEGIYNLLDQYGLLWYA